MLNLLKPLAFVFSLVLLTQTSMAQEATAPKQWKHESEAAIVTTSGNSETESYSGKQKTSYTFDLNVLTLAGQYLQTKSSGVETAKSWDASLRYERTLSDQWSVFVQAGAESNPYAAFIQRDNTDVGGKYYFIKKEKNEFFAELGARSSKTYATSGTVSTESLGRLYSEYSAPITDSMSGKLWVEYLANFTNSDAYRLNVEPSIYASLSEIFSLKVAYLYRYENGKVAPVKKTDTTTTISLVAKF